MTLIFCKRNILSITTEFSSPVDELQLYYNKVKTDTTLTLNHMAKEAWAPCCFKGRKVVDRVLTGVECMGPIEIWWGFFIDNLSIAEQTGEPDFIKDHPICF